MKRSFGAKPIIFPLPVLLIGTYDSSGRANLMTASWGGIVNSTPPMISVSVRRERHTHAALKANSEFTISIPQTSRAGEADYCGIYSNANSDKVTELGLNPYQSETINAPIFPEFPITLLCRVSQTVELGTHTMFVSEILDFQADESVIVDGELSIERIDPLFYDTISKFYYNIGTKVKKAYSEPKR